MHSNLLLDQEKCKKILFYSFVAELLMILTVCGILLSVNQAELSIDQNVVLCRNFLCIILFTIILFGFIRQGVFPKEKMYFIMMGVVISIALTADIVTWIADGNIQYANINKVCIAIDIMSNSALDYLFWNYIKCSYDDEGYTYKKFEEKLIVGFLIAGCIVPIADAFIEFGFYIDSAGVSQTMVPGVFTLYISPLVITVMMIIAIFRIRLSKQEKVILLLYLFAPLVAFTIYVVNGNSSTSFYPIVFATYVFIFCNLVVHRERENIKNEALLAGTKKELEVATKIQTSLLPLNFTDFDKYGVDLYAYMGTAKEVGGDFYDCFMIDENRIAVVIADVSGKGVPASLFMAIGKTLLSKSIKEEKLLSEAFDSVHRTLIVNNKKGMFITVFAGIIDLNNNTLTYCNAGHCLPLFRRNNGNFEYLDDIHGAMIGCLLSKDKHYDQSVIEFNEGDVLYLYTDGVTEAQNMAKEMYGNNRLLDCINSIDYKMSSKVIIDTIERDVREYAGEQEQSDDITMLCIKRTSKDLGSITTDAKNTGMDEITRYFDRFFERHDISNTLSNKLMIIIDEIYSNIANYSGATYARIDMNINENYIRLVFEDDGLEFNPLDIGTPDVSVPLQERAVGGLGIFVVKDLAQDIVYDRSNNKNILNISICI